MPKTRNGFYAWCLGVFLIGTGYNVLHNIAGLLPW